MRAGMRLLFGGVALSCVHCFLDWERHGSGGANAGGGTSSSTSSSSGGSHAGGSGGTAPCGFPCGANCCDATLEFCFVQGAKHQCTLFPDGCSALDCSCAGQAATCAPFTCNPDTAGGPTIVCK